MAVREVYKAPVFGSTVTQVHPAAPVELEIRRWNIVCCCGCLCYAVTSRWPVQLQTYGRSLLLGLFSLVGWDTLLWRQRSERPMGLMLPLVMLHPWELPQRGARTGQLIADKGLTPTKCSQGHLATWRDSESLASYYIPDITCYCLDNNNYGHNFNW